MNVPWYWRDEATGRLAEVVLKYLTGERMSPHEIDMMRAYIRQWIEGDLYRGREVDHLRGLVDSLTSRAQIERWLDRALDAGIDPL